MAIVGPGAVQDQSQDIKSTLEGASEFEYVTILNPLTDDFAVRVAQDVPVNTPFNISKDTSGKTQAITRTEQDARQVYGLTLKNPDFQGRRHIVNDTIIKAGQTINLKGNEAQVAVRQLVNEILQREDNKRLLADPNLRRKIEDRIIIGRGMVQDLMDAGIRTPQNQVDDAIKRSNEVRDEVAFPGLNQGATGQDQGPRTEIVDPQNDGQSPRRKVGRPKKTDS